MASDGKKDGVRGSGRGVGDRNDYSDFIDFRTYYELSLFFSRVVKRAKHACVPNCKLKSSIARRLFLSL